MLATLLHLPAAAQINLLIPWPAIFAALAALAFSRVSFLLSDNFFFAIVLAAVGSHCAGALSSVNVSSI